MQAAGTDQRFVRDRPEDGLRAAHVSSGICQVLGFRSYAAASSQARRRTLISSGAGWSGRDAFNLAAMMTRRSLAAMSAVDGWAFVVYQGARARCSATSAGSWPAVAYQQAVTAGQRPGDGFGHAAGQPQPRCGAGVLDDQLGQHRDGHGPAHRRQPHHDRGDHPVVPVSRFRRSRRGPVVEPGGGPHLLAAPPDRVSSIATTTGSPAGTSSATASRATARPRSSGFRRARAKNQCARSCGQARDSPAPASIPHTVRFPVCARNPQVTPASMAEPVRS
jgi:hypothetical protein